MRTATRTGTRARRRRLKDANRPRCGPVSRGRQRRHRRRRRRVLDGRRRAGGSRAVAAAQRQRAHRSGQPRSDLRVSGLQGTAVRGAKARRRRGSATAAEARIGPAARAGTRARPRAPAHLPRSGTGFAAPAARRQRGGSAPTPPRYFPPDEIRDRGRSPPAHEERGASPGTVIGSSACSAHSVSRKRVNITLLHLAKNTSG